MAKAITLGDPTLQYTLRQFEKWLKHSAEASAYQANLLRGSAKVRVSVVYCDTIAHFVRMSVAVVVVGHSDTKTLGYVDIGVYLSKDILGYQLSFSVMNRTRAHERDFRNVFSDFELNYTRPVLNGSLRRTGREEKKIHEAARSVIHILTTLEYGS